MAIDIITTMEVVPIMTPETVKAVRNLRRHKL